MAMKLIGTPREAIRPNEFFVKAIVNSATGSKELSPLNCRRDGPDVQDLKGVEPFLPVTANSSRLLAFAEPDLPARSPLLWRNESVPPSPSHSNGSHDPRSFPCWRRNGAARSPSKAGASDTAPLLRGS